MQPEPPTRTGSSFSIPMLACSVYDGANLGLMIALCAHLESREVSVCRVVSGLIFNVKSHGERARPHKLDMHRGSADQDTYYTAPGYVPR